MTRHSISSSGKKIHLLIAVMTFLCNVSFSQNPVVKDGLVRYLSADSTLYVKGTGLAQIWLRYNYNNPGSTVFGTPQAETFDVGIRRARYQVLGQISDRTFLYTQIGINSFNSVSARKTPIFFHDVTAEYRVAGPYLTVGAGLHGYNGTARYTSSGVGNILGLDLPLILEPTNDVTDQFVRKLGVFAKGKISRFDYRLSLSNPFPVQNALSPVAVIDTSLRNISFYNTEAPKLQSNGYFMWQFLEKESNLLPYMAGSYLGKKRVFNLGFGFTHQPDAFWHRQGGDTVRTDMIQLAADVFLELPLNSEKRNAVTFYAAYISNDFGPNYIRNSGPMNMANGVKGSSSFNGPGNAFPLYGTGSTAYIQGAYLFKNDLLGKQGTLQPYAQLTYSDYERLSSIMLFYSVGFNWLMAGNNSKISVEYADRPVFNLNSTNNLVETSRRGCVQLQYQVSF